MSSRTTIFLTSDNEHAFFDCSEPLKNDQNRYTDALTIEFSKQNIRIERNDSNDLIITITNANSDLYKIFEKLGEITPKKLK